MSSGSVQVLMLDNCGLNTTNRVRVDIIERRPLHSRYQLQLMIEAAGRHGLFGPTLSNTEAVVLSYHEEFRSTKRAQYPT